MSHPGGCLDWRYRSSPGRARRAHIAGFDDVVGSGRQRQSGENHLGRGCRELKRQIRNAGSGELIGRSRSRANLVGEIDSGRPPVVKSAVYSKAEMVTSVNSEVVVKLMAFPADWSAPPIPSGPAATSAMTVLACDGARPPTMDVAMSVATKTVRI